MPSNTHQAPHEPDGDVPLNIQEELPQTLDLDYIELCEREANEKESQVRDRERIARPGN